ncbi:g10145 [Coccomyxa elongata]
MEYRLKFWERAAMTAALALAFSMEQADVGVLQSMYGPIGRSLQVSAVALGTLTTWRGVVQAAVTPFVGTAGNVLNRIFLSAAGTLIWGITSVGIGSARNFSQAATFSSLNGIGLALVLSSVQSVLADIYRPEQRGLAFGIMLTAASVGQIAFNFMAIAEGGREVGSLEGWRFVFYVMAGVAGLTTLALLMFGTEPRSKYRKKPQQVSTKVQSPVKVNLKRGVDALKATMSDARQVFSVLSFVVILVAETIMVCGGAGAGYQILYFQITGFTDVNTATLNLCFNVGNAVGMATGGILGDLLSKQFPRFARPLVNQVSMVVVAPLFLILYKALPGSSSHTNGVPGHLHDLTGYGVLLFSMTIVAPWEQANNAAMFAEVLPENLRATGYAFDKGVTGLLGALAAPLVGLLAEKVWGGRGITDNSAFIRQEHG